MAQLAELEKKRKELVVLFKEKSGELVNYNDLLNIPSDQYVEVSKGFFAKVYLESAKNLTPLETESFEYVNSLGFNSDTHLIIFLTAMNGAFFNKHFHRREEYLFVIRGSFLDSQKEEIFHKGDVCFNKAMISHDAKALEDSFIVAVLPHDR